MRTVALVGVGAVIAGIALGFAVLGGSGAGAARPSIRLVPAAPSTIRGAHFRAGELVRVSSGSHATLATADGDGAFVVTIRGASRCDIVRVVARGSAGSYVVLKTLPAPVCLPVRSA